MISVSWLVLLRTRIFTITWVEVIPVCSRKATCFPMPTLYLIHMIRSPATATRLGCCLSLEGELIISTTDFFSMLPYEETVHPCSLLDINGEPSLRFPQDGSCRTKT